MGTYTSKFTGIEIDDLLNLVNSDKNNKKIVTTSSTSIELIPNRYYKNTNTSLSSLTITLGEITDSTIVNEYFIEFTTGNSTTISLPTLIKWKNGIIPTFEANTTYQISIINNLGVVSSFK